VAIVKGYLGSSLLASYVIQDNYAGLSGSPVVNGKNELVGIVSSWKFDISSGNWYNAPCSTDYLWETLYSYWIVKNKKTKSINSFQEFIANYKTQNGVAPVVTPYLITQLFYTDWLKSKGFKYGSIESYAEWSNKVMKENGIKITADPYQKSLLVFDSWKEGYAKGKSEIIDLEAKLAEAKVSIPNFIDFCEYSQELSSMGKHEKSIALLIYADQKIQHMGQLYAYLGDAYLAKGDKALAKENYLKCLKTYPEYPKATDGLLMLK
jgi:tetratricopeptide (TPR) repeat protein